MAVPALPYRGIQPYRYVDHPIFFERENETRELLSLVVVYRGVMLYGDSGAGKSSLINAGLVAGAIQNGFQPERIRVYPHDGAEFVVERTARTDAGDTFLPSLFAPDDETMPRIVLSTTALEEALRTGASTRRLLVFDQFEELVTLFDEPGHEEVQRRIADLLMALLRDVAIPVKFLFVFREDYLAGVKQLLGAAPELIDHALRLTPPSEESLTTIIRGPFDRYPGHFGRELSPALTERLRERLADRFGSGDMSLSEVQTVCLRLWQSEDPEPMLEERGVQGLLEDYLGEELDAFPPDLKYPAVALLSGMVTSAGTRNVMSAESLISHVREEEEEIPTEVLEQALDRLESKSKLVRRERRRSDLDLYEITSEFLVPWISSRREDLIRARERRQERRKLLLLGVAVGVLLAVVGGVAYLAVWALGQRDAARRGAASEASLVLASAANLQPPESDTAMLLSLAAFEKSKKADAMPHDAAWRTALVTLEAARLSGLVATLRGHHGRVLSLAFSPDGETLASAGDKDRTVLWSVKTHERIGRPLRTAAIGLETVAFSPDGSTLVTADRDGMVRLWSVRGPTEIGQPIKGDHRASAVAFSRDGSTIAVGDLRGNVRLWSLRTHAWLGAVMANGTSYVWNIAFSPDGRTLAVAGEHGDVWLWNAGTQERRKKPLVLSKDSSYDVYAVAFSPDGRTLATGDSDGTVRLWNANTHAQIGSPLRDHSIVFSLAFSRDGRRLVTADEHGKVRVWSVRTHESLGTPLNGHASPVFSVAFDRDGNTIAGGGNDGVVALWDLAAHGNLSVAVGTGSDRVTDAVFSHDGNRIATAQKDGTVRLWDAHTGSEIGPPMRGHKGEVLSVAFDPDGRLLASAGSDGTVRIWNAHAQKEVGRPLRGHKRSVWSVAFNPDGTELASGGEDHTVRLWDVATGEEIGPPLRGHKEAVDSVAFSPDGQTLASTGSDGTVRLWDAGTRTKVGSPLKTDPNGAADVTFSPDGHTLAAAGSGGVVYLWNFRSTKPRRQTLVGGSDLLHAVAFSPDGRTLASAESNGTVRLWDMFTRTQIGPILPGGHGRLANTVAFSPDGRTLLTSDYYGPARLWQGFLFSWDDFAYMRKKICAFIGGRTLSKDDWQRFAPGIAQPKRICPKSQTSG